MVLWEKVSEGENVELGGAELDAGVVGWEGEGGS